MPEIRRVRRMIEQIKAECDLEVAGGIDPETARLAVAAGANVLVAAQEFSVKAAGWQRQ